MERILVVSELDVGVSAIEALDGLKNVEIEIVSSLEEGVERIKKKKYLVVFSNLDLPLTRMAKKATKYSGGKLALECGKKDIIPIIIFEYQGYSFSISPVFLFRNNGFCMVPYYSEIKGKLREVGTWKKIFNRTLFNKI